MNAINSLVRDLADAKAEAALAQANRWPDDIRPLIQAYLDLGALLDRLEQGFNGWKPAGAHEELMADVHGKLAEDHGRLRRDIEDYRESVIEEAYVRPYSRNMTEDEHDERDAQYRWLLDCAVSVDAAVKAVMS